MNLASPVKAPAPQKPAQPARVQPVQRAVDDSEEHLGASRRCACGGGCSACQAKSDAPLSISTPGDYFEREADRAADTVTSSLYGRSSIRTMPSISPYVAPVEEAAAPASTVMRASSAPCAGGEMHDFAARADRAHGEPLSSGTRARMEQGFGVNFGSVRVHTDVGADGLARDIGARAFTTGEDIYFRSEEYRPGTSGGDWLLAHELTHVVQQSRSSTGILRRVQRVATLAETWSGVRTAVRSGAAAVRETVSAGADTVREAAGTVRDAAVDVAHSARDLVEGYLEEHAPGVLAFLRGDLAAEIRQRIYQGLDYLFNGLGQRIQTEGIGETARVVFGEFVEGVNQVVTDLANGRCESLFAAMRMIGAFGARLTGPAFHALREAARTIGAFFNDLWARFGAPVADAIQSLAGGTWEWLTAKAQWLWDQTEGVRQWFHEAWEGYKRRFNLAWDSSVSILASLREKAAAAWEQIKHELGPWLRPLQVAAGALLLISPLGPVVAIGAGGYALWEAIGWLRTHWDDIGHMVVTARQYLHDHVLARIMRDLNWLQGVLSRAREWVAQQAANLVTALASLIDALGLTPMLNALRRVIGGIAGSVSRTMQYLSTQVSHLFSELGRIAARLHHAMRPFYGLIAAVLLFPQFPFLLPIVLTGWAWRLSPACVKPPIIDFALDMIIRGVRPMPAFRNFGTAWAHAKAHMLRSLEHVRQMSFEKKVEISNRVARIMTGEDIAWIGNLIEAARNAPGEFTGQAQEELLGMDLSAPLPFERSAVPSVRESLEASAALGDLTPSDMRILSGGPLTQGDVAVEAVAQTTWNPDLIAEIGLHSDGERWLGAGAAEGPRGLRAEIAGTPPVGNSAAANSPQRETTSPALTPEQEIERRLETMMEPQPPGPCEQRAETPAATQADFPEAMKFGPLTQAQRARYLWSQLKQGTARWIRCNAYWLIPSLVLAVAALIGLEILTEGAITAALPAIMELLGSILVGVAVVRATYYVGEYVVRAVSGDVQNAAKSLARGLAAAAIEIAFALLFNLGAVIKTVRRGAQATVEAIASSARKTVTGAIEATQSLGRTVKRGSQALVSNVRRAGGAVLRQGRLIMEGVTDGFAKGVRTLGELMQRLRRFRFRGFSLERRGHLFLLWGHFNPKILLATGKIEEVSLAGTGVRPTLGARATTAAGERGIIVGVRDTDPSEYIRYLENLSEGDRQALFRRLNRLGEAERRLEVAALSQTAENARQLRASMLSNPRTGRGLAGDGAAAHHIVPSTHGYGAADEARKILDELGISINDGLNGVFVPPEIHAYLHTHEYMDAVADALRQARKLRNPRAAAERALDQLAGEILEGHFTR